MSFCCSEKPARETTTSFRVRRERASKSWEATSHSREGSTASKEAEAPLQTSCSPEDVADVILGLITGSDLVTGESLTVDAGHTLGGGW